MSGSPDRLLSEDSAGRFIADFIENRLLKLPERKFQFYLKYLNNLSSERVNNAGQGLTTKFVPPLNRLEIEVAGAANFCAFKGLATPAQAIDEFMLLRPEIINGINDRLNLAKAS